MAETPSGPSWWERMQSCPVACTLRCHVAAPLEHNTTNREEPQREPLQWHVTWRAFSVPSNRRNTESPPWHDSRTPRLHPSKLPISRTCVMILPAALPVASAYRLCLTPLPASCIPDQDPG